MPSPLTALTCDALLFDLDGVLVDSTACVEDTCRRWASRHGLDADTIVRMAHGRRALDTVRLAAPHLDDAGVEAEVASLAAHEARETAGVVEVPGAAALLRDLPHPEGYLTAAARLGISPAACLVVEDAP